MKNLKKVLALVLVVVMALGLITVSNAAAFTDAQSITKTEAVDVLSAIGVINGYPDGSFKPEGEVTRAEMAKMVATIMNEGDDVGELYKNACKFADSANHWAAGYIAYCAQAGIINGKSETKFDPDGKVTGTEAAKMLLCALGYKADAEGFVGANWASAVLAKAAEAHLVGKTYNMTANMGEALNRENTAQMMLNALQADTVKYKTSGTTITAGDVKISTGAEFEKKVDGGIQYANIDARADANGDFYVQLGEEKFDKLTLTPAQNDDFGRPANQWYFEGKQVSLAPTAADFEYKDLVKGGTIYADLGKVTFNNTGLHVDGKYDVVYYVDGVKTYDNINGVATAAAEIAKIVSAGKLELGQVGSKIEIYKDVRNEIVTIIRINYYTDTINAVFAKKTNAAGDVSKLGYVVLAAAGTIAPGAQDEGAAITNANAYVTENFTSADVGARVIFTKAGATAGTQKIQSVEKAEAITGLFSSSVAGTPVYESVVIGGTSYNVTTNVATALTRNTEVTAYLDPNGNIQYMEGVASKDFVYLLANENKTGDFGASTNMGRILFTDGTVKEVELAASTYADDTLYTYTTDAKSVYTLTAVPATALTQKAPEAKNNTAFAGGTNKLNYFTNVKVNNDTLFIVETRDAATDTAVYTTYTGVNNLPTIASAYYTDASWATYAAKQSGTGDYIAAGGAVTSVTPKGDTYATVVYVFGTVITSTSNDVTALFMTAKDAEYTDADNNTYFEVKAVVNGSETKVKVAPSAHGTGLTVANSLTMDNDIISAKSEDTMATDAATTGTVFNYGPFAYNTTEGYTGNYKSGNIVLGTTTFNVDAAIPVYVYNTESGEMTTTTVGTYIPTGDPTDGSFSTADVVKVRWDINPNANTNAKIAAIYVIETNE